jgi:nucleotide-binding universal stress UspA family protein
LAAAPVAVVVVVVTGAVITTAPLPAAAPSVGAAVAGFAAEGAAPGVPGNTSAVSVISDPPQAICNTIADNAQADTRAIGSSFVQS